MIEDDFFVFLFFWFKIVATGWKLLPQVGFCSKLLPQVGGFKLKFDLRRPRLQRLVLAEVFLFLCFCLFVVFTFLSFFCCLCLSFFFCLVLAVVNYHFQNNLGSIGEENDVNFANK